MHHCDLLELSYIWDILRDLVPFAQFWKTPMKSVTLVKLQAEACPLAFPTFPFGDRTYIRRSLKHSRE